LKIKYILADLIAGLVFNARYFEMQSFEGRGKSVPEIDVTCKIQLPQIHARCTRIVFP